MNKYTKQMRVEYETPIMLHSGGKSKVKYEIERLSNAELREIIRATGNIVTFDQYQSVWSIGGGLRLAQIINEVWRIPIGISNYTLLVDDVFTTGKTLIDLKKQVEVAGGKAKVAFVLVKRGNSTLWDLPIYVILDSVAEELAE